MLRTAILTIGVVSITMISSAWAVEPTGPEGLWRLSSGKLTVKISYCNAPKICANIHALSKPKDKRGNPKLDRENPNPTLRKRPVIGLTIMSGMKPKGSNSWTGTIYNADDGRTYSAEATLSGNRLQVKGCWAFFCKKLKFKRLEEVAQKTP